MRALEGWPPGLRAVVGVGATTLFMVLVAWATLVGPDAVFTGPGPTPGPASTRTESCIPLPVRTEADGTTTVVVPDDVAERDYCDPPPPELDDHRDLVEQNPPPLWVKVLVWVFLGVLLLAVVAGVVRLAIAAVRALLAHRPEGPRPEVDVTLLDEPGRVARSMADDADEQDALLRDGEARNAIVAAWHRFEVQGARAGVERRPSETSSEFVLRVLDVVDADAVPVNRLAELYREARFSDHPITEEHRGEALAALEGIRRSLEVRS